MFTTNSLRPPRLRRGVDLAMSLPIMMSLMGADQAGKVAPSAPIILFDGKTLDGWKRTEFFRGGAVQVSGGMIAMAPGRAMTGITTTRENLPKSNYELSYEAMRLTGEDFFAAATFPVGSSFVTLVNGGWGGSVTGLSSLNGSDASENETNQFVSYRNKVWYRFRIRVTDQTIVCQVDDKPVVTLKHRDYQLSTRIETRPNQPLGFATYNSSGALRNLVIRTLTPQEITEIDKAVQAP